MANLNQSLDAALSQLGYDDEMGAARQRMTPQGRRLLGSSIAPGVPKPGYKRQVTGLGTHTFTSGGGNSVTLSVAPLKPLVIRKLVAIATPNGPTAARQVNIGTITIGSQVQQATANPIPIQLFGEQTTDNMLDLDVAPPGVPIIISVEFQGAALLPGEEIFFVLGGVVETIG